MRPGGNSTTATGRPYLCTAYGQCFCWSHLWTTVLPAGIEAGESRQPIVFTSAHSLSAGDPRYCSVLQLARILDHAEPTGRISESLGIFVLRSCDLPRHLRIV